MCIEISYEFIIQGLYMSSNNKQTLKALIAEQERSRVLDKKWHHRKPEKDDFSLAGVDIDKLCGARAIHYAKCEKRAEEILKEMPSEKSWSSISLGWEGIVMFLLCIALGIYYYFVGTPTQAMPVVVTIISFGTVGIYVYRALRAKAARKQEIKDLQQLRKDVLNEEFDDESTYERIYGFAKALADYETWQAIGKPAYWKDRSASEVRESIFGLFATAGYEPDGTYDEYVDFLAKIDNQEVAVACPGSKRVTRQLIDGFVDEIKDHELTTGLLYVFGKMEGNASSLFTKNEAVLDGVTLKLQNVDEVMKIISLLD